jgi:hypothetical protein
MNNNIWISLIVTYARPDTRPREECGQSRERKDAILKRRVEAATTDQLETIDIRATVYEAGGIRKGGESRTSHGRSQPSSNEGGGWEKKRHRLYKRVKWMTEPKNKREGIDTCDQSISDINAWNAPSSSLQKLLVNTSPVLQNRGKILPSADLHGKSVETATKTNPKHGPKKPSCKEETDQLAQLVGSNAWAKKKKKAELKKDRKQRRRLHGPLYPYTMRINGIEAGSFLTLTEWHSINSDLVGWIANKILNASPEEDLSLFNIEEYKFIENPEKDGVKTALKPNNERKGYGLLLFKNIQSKNMGERAVRACGLPDPTSSVGRSALSHEAVETDQRAVYTTLVNKYFWAGTDKVWAVAQKVLKEKLPIGSPGIELEKSLSTTRDKNLTNLVLQASAAWETAIDLLKGELTIAISTLKLNK